MPKANTYKAERMLGPYGFSVTDVMVIDGNRRRPATFNKIGDSIDLTRVDIKTLVKSAVNGQINKLLVGGALSTMQQEVSEQIETDIQQALTEFGLSNFNDHPVASNMKYVTLEPGVMVAIAVAPEPPKEVHVIQPPEPPTTAQLEPGLTVPTAHAGGNSAETLSAPAVEDVASAAAAKGSKRSQKKADETAKTDPYAEWKFNLDFQTCKRNIIESTDKKFLEWVAAKDDSVQFQKLAKTRLAQV